MSNERAQLPRQSRRGVDWTAFSRPRWAALALFVWALLIFGVACVPLYAIYGSWRWPAASAIALFAAYNLTSAWDRGWRP